MRTQRQVTGPTPTWIHRTVLTGFTPGPVIHTSKLTCAAQRCGCTRRAFIHWWLNYTRDTLSLYSQAAELYPFYGCVQWAWGLGAPQRIFQAKHAWFLLIS